MPVNRKPSPRRWFPVFAASACLAVGMVGADAALHWYAPSPASPVLPGGVWVGWLVAVAVFACIVFAAAIPWAVAAVIAGGVLALCFLEPLLGVALAALAALAFLQSRGR